VGTFSLAAHNEDIGALTPTEAVALEGYSAGLTRAEIATSLGLSARTVGRALTVAKEKLAAKSLGEAAAHYASSF
jgi:DNA-binding CsgD family transcriptional regulator